MSYQNKDYEELIDRADDLVDKKRYAEAWECIAAIPDDVKINEFPDECAFFAFIALECTHYDHFIRYIRVYLKSFPKADEQFIKELEEIFYTMISKHGDAIYYHVARLIEIVLARFRTAEVLTTCAGALNIMRCPDEAVGLLDEALDQNPFYSMAWYNKSFAYHLIGDNAKEIEACNYYLAIVPDTKDYCILTPVAMSYANAGRHEDVLALLKKLLTNKELTSDQLAQTHSLLAETYNAMSDYKRELYHRKKALNYHPEEVAYWSMLAQYYITSENRPLKAEKIMEEALTQYPRDPVAHYMYAAVKCQIAIETQDQWKLEIAAYHIEKALRKYKDNILFHLLAARIYLLLYDYKHALKHSRNAYRMDPNNITAILYMVLSYFGCGRITEFRKLYRIYAKLNPNAREDIIAIIPGAQSTIDKIK